MNEIRKSGIICVRGDYNIEYKLCRITQITHKEDDYSYVFEPNYSVMDLLTPFYFDGIPGLDLDLRKTIYMRSHMRPVFISERVPPNNREDLYELLEEVGMTYMDPLEYLIRTDMRYSGDLMYVIPDEKRMTVNINNDISKHNLASMIRIILKHVCAGDNVVFENYQIDDKNRKDAHQLLMSLYSKTIQATEEKRKQGIRFAKENGEYRGRKPIPLDLIAFVDEYNLVKNKKTTAKQAANNLGISIDKYYRTLKDLKEKNMLS